MKQLETAIMRSIDSSSSCQPSRFFVVVEPIIMLGERREINEISRFCMSIRTPLHLNRYGSRRSRNHKCTANYCICKLILERPSPTTHTHDVPNSRTGITRRSLRQKAWLGSTAPDVFNPPFDRKTAQPNRKLDKTFRRRGTYGLQVRRTSQLRQVFDT